MAPLPAGCEAACPACRYRGLSPEESAARKAAWAARCLGPLSSRLGPLRAPRAPWGYRRKALLHARRKEDRWAFGLLRRAGRELELVEIPGCPLHASAVNERLAFLREALPSTLPLAFVLASGGFLTLVLKCHASDSWRNLLRPLEGPLRALGVEGLQLNWNPSAGRRVLSSRHQEALYGPGELPSEDGFYGPLSFRQQIPEMENAALAEAEAFLAEARPEAALDLYCGNGATLARWRARGWRAVGVELVGEACSLAARNAPGATILKGKVEQRLPQLDALLGPNFALFTNPPRDGHAPEVNDWILTRRPTRIAYLSCNPRSLARDLTALVEGGYELSSVLPFDFFPNTDHVEALALLARNSRLRKPTASLGGR